MIYMKLLYIFVCICNIAIKLWNKQENNKGRILNLKEKKKRMVIKEFEVIFVFEFQKFF